MTTGMAFHGMKGDAWIVSCFMRLGDFCITLEGPAFQATLTKLLSSAGLLLGMLIKTWKL
jgi:hypothetical protein